MLDILPHSHSRFVFSLISGDEQQRVRMGGACKQYTDADFLAVMQQLSMEEIPVTVYYSNNLPGESDEAFQATLALASQLQEMFPEGILEQFCEPHTIEPLSTFASQPEHYGVIPGLHTYEDYRAYCRCTRRIDALGLNTLRVESILERQAQWQQTITRSHRNDEGILTV